ncbi:MAG TPA: hypothetical protein VK671_06430 [Mucilaginibacter sp.]|jgi:hypothetical protein|nr:hypothetical protein [Mucilaginibacter sp.]
MKIRIKGNSLRYRLTKSDMYRLAQEGYLEDKTNFGKRELIYVIQKTNESELSAFFDDNVICLQVPVKMIEKLDKTDRVSFEGKQGELLLLVEKDFTCLDNVDEDQSDNYPNPLAEK